MSHARLLAPLAISMIAAVITAPVSAADLANASASVSNIQFSFQDLASHIVDGSVVLSPAQLALLIEAMDWRRTVAPPLPRQPMLV